MSRFVRASKFRHVYGDPFKKDECYDNVPITRSAWDSNFCAVNEKFLAVVLEASGGGAFMVLTHDHTGKIDTDAPRVVGHKSAVNDVAWNPFNANMVASGSDDCTVKVWIIPDGGLKENLSTPALSLDGHHKKVGGVYWHPSAADLLFTTSNDLTIRVWNVATGECANVINGHTDSVYSLSFNADGSKFVTTCKDKKLRIFNAHTGEMEKEVEGHTGTKASRAVWLTNKDMILTTGFSRQSDRQYKLYDATLTQLKEENIDTSSGVLMPFYDADLSIIYLAGKGDGNVRYYELEDKKPYVFFLSEFKSPDPQRGMGWLPKRACDVSKCEVARFYKLHPKGLVEPIRMIVPRKADSFQEDIYPDCEGDQPALTASAWLGGADAPPKRISLRDGFKPSEQKEFVAPAPVARTHTPPPTASSSSSMGPPAPVTPPKATPAPEPVAAAAAAPAPAANEEEHHHHLHHHHGNGEEAGKHDVIAKLSEEVRALKDTLRKQQDLIESLEERLRAHL